MPEYQTLELPIQGMDCAECTMHVQKAISAIPGVESVSVYLSSEKAVISLDPQRVNIEAIQEVVERTGYAVVTPDDRQNTQSVHQDFTRPIMILLGVVFGVVLFVVVIGEWLGLFEQITEMVPLAVGVALVILAGYPVFRNVLRAALRGQVLAHTLMTIGVIAALVIGEWATAAVVVFFMRVGDYVERFTTERARRAVKDLAAMAPQSARLLQDGQEIEVHLESVQPGDVVVVRPGEVIPVDGEVQQGFAVVDQSSLTGESMPVEKAPGMQVYAATIAHQGSLRIRAKHLGTDSTFGKVIKLVEEAEAHRADVQRLADKFSAYYLPIVAGIAALTFLVRRDPLATAAVLVVACSCAFALATPIAMLASIGAGARRGLMFKGGKYLELLAKADVLLVDKTGTLTLGKPVITDIFVLDGMVPGDSSEIPDGATSYAPPKSWNPPDSTWDNQSLQLLRLAASAERYSEHPLAEAVRIAAQEQGITLDEPGEFTATPGLGVRARINGSFIQVGSMRLFPGAAENVLLLRKTDEFVSQGKTVLYIAVDERIVGMMAAADRLRPEVPRALAAVMDLGVQEIRLLTGDNPQTAATLSADLGVEYQAGLLPEDKIRIVKEYQSRGHTVVMVGDGVNDAPALAQADVGIAMGSVGSNVAIEAAHVALMRDDWLLVPESIRIARRTMRVVRGNIWFTALYNLVGLSLAALGILPPVLAAAAQSIPDLGILANSSRLLRQNDYST